MPRRARGSRVGIAPFQPNGASLSTASRRRRKARPSCPARPKRERARDRDRDHGQRAAVQSAVAADRPRRGLACGRQVLHPSTHLLATNPTRTRAAVTRRASHSSVTHGECKMAFAKRKTGGGESFPLVKWDGRVGRLYIQDREQDERGEWHSVQNDVTDGFVAAFNLAGTEHGYMRFPKGAAPETVMVPMGEDIGEMPEGENWQEGLRLQVKMPGEDFWRTLMSSAIGLWRSLSRLHDQYVELAQKHPGKVPVVELIEVVEIKGRTTSYAPTFGIIGWISPDEVLQRPTRGDMDDKLPF